MKKAILVLLFIFAITVTPFCADFKLSAGGGPFYSLELGPYGNIKNSELHEDPTYYNLGAFLFFDATYIEANASFLFGSSNIRTTGEQSGIDIDSTVDGSITAIEIGLLGKYPFNLGRFLLYPLFGINYRFVLSYKTDGKAHDKASDHNSLGFQPGIGLDYSLAGNLYLRGEILWDIRLLSKMQNDRYEDMSNEAWSARYPNGPRIKVGLGYSFY